MHFFESESIEIDREAIVSLLLLMLIKLKPFDESGKGTAGKSDPENLEKSDKETVEEIDREFIFKQMQTETSPLLSTLDLFKRYSVSCEKMAKTDFAQTYC